MSWSRFSVALAIVLGFIVAAFVWTRPPTRIDQTIDATGSSSPRAPHAPRVPRDAASGDR